MAWKNARERELKVAEGQFLAHVGVLASQVQQLLNSYAWALRGSASLFGVLEHPSPQHWRNYADGLDMRAQFPSLTGMGFAACVDPSQLAQLQIQLNATGYGRLDVRPHGVRQHYGPILYLEPRTPENLSAIGYDMYAEPVRQAAMRAAMDTGQPQLSGVVQLVQDRNEPAAGMLLFTRSTPRCRRPETPSSAGPP